MGPSRRPRRTRRAASVRAVGALCLLLIGVLGSAQAQAGSSVSVTITSSPPSQTTSSSATISFTSNGAKTIACQLDGGSLSICSSPVSYSGLSIGTHTFVVKASSGGRSSKATATWVVVSSGSGSFGVTSSIADGSTLSGSLSWEAKTSRSASEVAFYIDGTLRWTEYYAPYLFNGDVNKLDTGTLPNGMHVLKVAAVASDGAKAEASATVQVSNGSSSPFTVISSIVNGSTVAGSVPWTATTSQTASQVDFYIDGTLRWTEVAAPYVFGGDGNNLNTSMLTDGSHVLRVVATASSNWATTETSATVQVDNGASQVDNGASGTTYWVATSGSDGNVGSQSSPWRTISHAVSIAGAGDTVVIVGGSYAEDVKMAVSGGAGSPVTVRANAGDTVTVRSLNLAASHLVVGGLNVTGASGPCVAIQPAVSDVTLRDSQIHGCGSDGIRFVRTTSQPYTTQSQLLRNKVYGVGTSDTSANDLQIYANYLTVEGCDLSGAPNDGIDMWGDHLTFRANYIHDISNSYGHHNDAFQTWNGLNDGAEGNPVTNLLVERNHIANIIGSDAHGFMVEGPGNNYWTVRNNVIENIGSIGMIFGITGTGNSSLGLAVYNNTFVNAGPNDVVEFNSKDTGSFSNNILQGGGGLYITTGTTVVHDNNIFSGTTSNVALGAHDKNVSPGFVNASAGDYHLASGSPAVNAGDNGNIDPLRPYDFDGNPNNGIVDIGAHEYQG